MLTFDQAAYRDELSDKEYERLVFTNKAPDIIDLARRHGRRVVWCRYSNTIRQAPQNYLLACRSDFDGRFHATPDKASTINAHSLSIVTRQFYEQNKDHDPRRLAEYVELHFYGSIGKP